MSFLVEYPGWSTFRVTPESGPSVVFDPCISRLLAHPCAEPEQVRADVMLLTHGHHEHIRDVHRVAHAGPIVAPPQVIDYLVRKRRMERRRFTPIVPDAIVELDGLRVTARGFPHLEKHDVKGKLGVLGRGNPLGGPAVIARHLHRVVLGWLVIGDQPDEGPFLAYDLRWDEGPRVFFTCEAFTSLLDPAEPARWGAGDRPIDLALVGVESSFEDAARAHTDALAPLRAAAAAVHAPFEQFYGKPPVDGARWVGDRPRSFWEPGARVRVT